MPSRPAAAAHYNTQSGVGTPRPNAPRSRRPIGYNQLLSTNTVSLFGRGSGHFIAALERKGQDADRRSAQTHSSASSRALKPHDRSFAAACRTAGAKYDEIAKNTPKGWGIHAAVLDIDVGPLLQVQKLLDSVRFARAKGYKAPLTAAELELMNLTGDGNGIDMVTMPQGLREQVPTANFFQPNGYARNPVARRTKVVAGLIAEIQGHMDRTPRRPARRRWRRGFTAMGFGALVHSHHRRRGAAGSGLWIKPSAC